MLKGLAGNCIFPISYRRYTSDLTVVDEEELAFDDAAGMGAIRPTPESDRSRGDETGDGNGVGPGFDDGRLASDGVAGLGAGVEESSSNPDSDAQSYCLETCEVVGEVVLESALDGRGSILEAGRSSWRSSCTRSCRHVQWYEISSNMQQDLPPRNLFEADMPSWKGMRHK
jgi:hypothetical protein